jgi:hypothetical protein
VAGDHTIHFLTDNERLSLSHMAENRGIFARGAVRAAQWLLAARRAATRCPTCSASKADPLKKDQIFEFFRRLAEANPAPETELAYGNTYQLLVAVTISAQATDVGVNKATKRLFEEVKTPAQMVALGEEGLKEHIKSIGLFNTKAKNVIALSQSSCAIMAARFRRVARR